MTITNHQEENKINDDQGGVIISAFSMQQIHFTPRYNVLPVKRALLKTMPPKDYDDIMGGLSFNNMRGIYPGGSVKYWTSMRVHSSQLAAERASLFFIETICLITGQLVNGAWYSTAGDYGDILQMRTKENKGGTLKMLYASRQSLKLIA